MAERQKSRLTQRIVIRLVVGIVGCWAAYVGLTIYAKYDWCQGWSENFAARAANLRKLASVPGTAEADVRKILVNAEILDLAAEKFHAAAVVPWHPYPSAPLVSDFEEQAIRDCIRTRFHSP